jgi:histidinol-phosphate aminotransferase
VTDEPSLRLHLNENTAGCSPAVIAAIRAMATDDISCYPDYAAVTATVERWLGLDAGWVQLTNGLDEGIHVAAQSVAADGIRRGLALRAAVIVEPAFEMYAICARAAELPVVRIPPLEQFSFPVDAVVQAIAAGAGLVYLTDPNNPTGVGIPRASLEAIGTAATDTLVMIDEAYADFSGRSSIDLLPRFHNFVVGRTFAKAHGLAGLRVGALVGHPETLAPLRRILPPFTLNACAVQALPAALQDTGFLQSSVSSASRSKALIYDFCQRRGLTYWPSEANFVLVRVGANATALVRALADRGILIRDRSDQPGCDGCIRITAGVVEHTQMCLAALEAIIAARAD